MSDSILAKTYFVLFLRVSLESTDSLEPHARRTLQAKAVETIDAAHHFAVALHWPPFWAMTELTHLGSGGGSTHCAEGREAESRGGAGVVRGSSGNEGGRSCGRCGRETHHFRLAGWGLLLCGGEVLRLGISRRVVAVVAVVASSSFRSPSSPSAAAGFLRFKIVDGRRKTTSGF